MHPQLRVTPTDRLAQRTAAKTVSAALDARAFALADDVAFNELKEPSRLRRQLIERASEHFVRERIRERNVGERRLEVLDRLAVAHGRLYLALPLVQERDRVDQGQILFVIATRARRLVGKRQGLRVGIQHFERPQEPLRVPVQFLNLGASRLAY